MQGWQIVGIYQDDGYTGLNMNRPDMQRMLEDVKKHRIDLIITKDSSRKVHSSYMVKAKKGKFTGCLAPFGYKKSEED